MSEALLLDTSAYIAFMRNQPAVVEKIRSADRIVLNPVAIAELLSGWLRRPAPNQKRIFEEFIFEPRVGIVSIEKQTGDYYASIQDYVRRAGTPMSSNDLWIAASAMQHGLRVLTSDRDFQRIPQVLVEFFEPT